MHSPPSATVITLRTTAALLVTGLLATACTTPDGFTIEEEVGAGLGVRSTFQRAMGLLEDEAYEEGIALLLEVTESAPHSSAAHIDLGIAYRHLDELEKAEASLQKALELNPRHPAALNEMGIVYRRTGRFDRARKSYEAALDVYPRFHFARRNLAILCDVFLKDLDCAIENYEIYSRAVPADKKTAMWIADLRNRSGQ